MPAKKGLLHDGLSLPDSGAVLICWGKCTINTNALCNSIGSYKPAGLSTIVCLTKNDCQGKQIFWESLSKPRQTSSACFKVVCYTVCLGTCTGSITWKKRITEDI